VSDGAATSAGGRNALLSNDRPLLCLLGGTFHALLIPDSFVEMTDEDNAAALSLDSFHDSESFFCNNTMDYYSNDVQYVHFAIGITNHTDYQQVSVSVARLVDACNAAGNRRTDRHKYSDSAIA